jgi:phosphohistidine swiveling domain-containing protein
VHLGLSHPGPLAPKISVLARLHAAGLPVPDGVVLRDPAVPGPADRAAIAALLQGGPVIVRTALFEEDTADAAAAGLGTSVADCRDLAAVDAALARARAGLADPWLRAYLGRAPSAQMLVQRQIDGPWLAVVALGRVRYAELHRRAGDPLAAGATPTLSAPLDWFPPDLRARLTDLCDRAAAALPTAVHGLDLELVGDPSGAAWLVQARPLTRPLDPDWPAFAAAARRDLEVPRSPRDLDPRPVPARDLDVAPLPLPGLWVLDAEHNPAPLSPAHAGLVRRLAAADVAAMQVLAGWLYERRDPPAPPRPVDPAAAPAALRRLLRELLPAARRRLAALDVDLAAADGPALAELLDRAVADLTAVLRDHAELRAAAPRSPHPDAPAATPLSLQGRGEYLDVLPAAWDIASPTLADLSLTTGPEDHVREDIPPSAAATLLRELDDHLFALGLAAVRRVYLRAAARLGLAAADVFLYTPPELQTALRGGAELGAGAGAPGAVGGEADAGPHHGGADAGAPGAAGGEADAGPHHGAGAGAPGAIDGEADAGPHHGEAGAGAPGAAGGAELDAGPHHGEAGAGAPGAVGGEADAGLHHGEAGAGAPGAVGAPGVSLAARRAELRDQADLRPPLQLLDGLPVPAPADARRRGLGLGPSAEGPLHPRRDLEDLLARPLPAGAILAIPALTAQAAVALRALGLRAVCCEHGGVLSHAALMARELGLSALIGCRGCTELPEGARVHLDTRTGRLRPLRS